MDPAEAVTEHAASGERAQLADDEARQLGARLVRREAREKRFEVLEEHRVEHALLGLVANSLAQVRRHTRRWRGSRRRLQQGGRLADGE